MKNIIELKVNGMDNIVVIHYDMLPLVIDGCTIFTSPALVATKGVIREIEIQAKEIDDFTTIRVIRIDPKSIQVLHDIMVEIESFEGTAEVPER